MKKIFTAILFLSFAAAQEKPEDAVVAAYKMLEKSLRDGDGALWLRLHDRKTVAELPEEMKQNLLKGVQSGRGVPMARYEPTAVRVQKDRAVIIGNIVVPKEAGLTFTHHSVSFVREDSEWKITDEHLSENPIDPVAVYALLPPDDGWFAGTDTAWQPVRYAALNTSRFKPADLPWKMQATVDDSFLYMRFEAASPLPASGTEMVKAPGAQFPEKPGPEDPPVMKVMVAGAPKKNIEMKAGSVIQTRATYDESAKKYSNRFFVQYSLIVTKPTQGVQIGDKIFESGASDRFGSLITARDRYLEIKIPLKVLGLDRAAGTKIAIEEYNSLPKILPYEVVSAPRPSGSAR
jgi:hypothetical protein